MKRNDHGDKTTARNLVKNAVFFPFVTTVCRAPMKTTLPRLYIIDY